MASSSRHRPKVCVECGRLGTPDDVLSRRALHSECALRRASEAARQMAAKEGPYYDEWLRSMRHASHRLVDQFG